LIIARRGRSRGIHKHGRFRRRHAQLRAQDAPHTFKYVRGTTIPRSRAVRYCPIRNFAKRILAGSRLIYARWQLISSGSRDPSSMRVRSAEPAESRNNAGISGTAVVAVDQREKRKQEKKEEKWKGKKEKRNGRKNEGNKGGGEKRGQNRAQRKNRAARASERPCAVISRLRTDHKDDSLLAEGHCRPLDRAESKWQTVTRLLGLHTDCELFLLWWRAHSAAKQS